MNTMYAKDAKIEVYLKNNEVVIGVPKDEPYDLNLFNNVKGKRIFVKTWTDKKLILHRLDKFSTLWASSDCLNKHFKKHKRSFDLDEISVVTLKDYYLKMIYFIKSLPSKDFKNLKVRHEGDGKVYIEFNQKALVFRTVYTFIETKKVIVNKIISFYAKDYNFGNYNLCHN